MRTARGREASEKRRVPGPAAKARELLCGADMAAPSSHSCCLGPASGTRSLGGQVWSPVQPLSFLVSFRVSYKHGSSPLSQ